jgi:hypothetical protein
MRRCFRLSNPEGRLFRWTKPAFTCPSQLITVTVDAANVCYSITIIRFAISNVRGVIGYAVKPGSFNTASFTQFIHDLDAPVGSAILMDNVSFHHYGDTMEAISMKGFTALYTPPYCPELNPVEYSFSVPLAQNNGTRTNGVFYELVTPTISSCAL